MKPQDVVIFGLARWDGAYASTTLALAQALSKKHRVFYIDNPFTLKALIQDRGTASVKNRIKAILWGTNSVQQPFSDFPDLHTVIPPWVLPINPLPKGIIYRVGMRINNFLVHRRLTKIRKAQDIKQPVYINIFNPFYLPRLPKLWNCRIQMYYTVDNIGHSDYIKKHGPWLEQEAMQKADLSLATSKDLQKRNKRFGEIAYLPNAADIKLFESAWKEKLPCPKELSGLTGDVILYTGNMSIREDYTLLKEIALAYPEKHLVMVGPLNTDTPKKNGLTSLTNVHFTGGKHISELPAFLAHAQCAIIPFLCNELTAGIYPLKINEYLGAGIPVVATKFSEDIESFASVISLSESHEAFIAAIRKEIDGNSQEKTQARIKFAQANNWGNRAKRLEEIIENHLSN